MEAKVDIQKLQILNDRINQTIDALNQVRQTVRGISHTGFEPWSVPQPYLGATYGMQQYGMPEQLQPWNVPGLQHSPYVVQSPMLSPTQIPYVDPRFTTGISHTNPQLFERFSLESQALDPRRLTQTFPFLVSQSPFVRNW